MIFSSDLWAHSEDIVVHDKGRRGAEAEGAEEVGRKTLQVPSFPSLALGIKNGCFLLPSPTPRSSEKSVEKGNPDPLEGRSQTPEGGGQ